MTRDFLDFLEYEISNAFKESGNTEIQGFWCDGLLTSQPDHQYSKDAVGNNRFIILKAFTGRDGQQEFELTLKLGDMALSHYLSHSLDDSFAGVFDVTGIEISYNPNRISISLS